jgi:hypothetical protein
MIVGNIFSNLGNQLFIYAATKSISLDLGYEYRYIVIRPGFAKKTSKIDNFGHEYTEHFEHELNINTAERISQIPSSVNKKWTWKRTKKSNNITDVYNIDDNTVLDGYFLSPKYFEHRREEVLKWFSFNNDIVQKCKEKRVGFLKKSNSNHLVSIHVRCGKDYRNQMQVIDPSYQKEAIEYLINKFRDEKLCFVLFSDDLLKAEKMLRPLSKDMIQHHGSMFEDLCMMTLCDSHIIANSTFSWWGAWLAESSKGLIIRPSNWPTADEGFVPIDIFPNDWFVIKAERAKMKISEQTALIIEKQIYKFKGKIKKMYNIMFKLAINRKWLIYNKK